MCVEITSCPLPQHVRVVIKFDSWYCTMNGETKDKMGNRDWIQRKGLLLWKREYKRFG